MKKNIKKIPKYWSGTVSAGNELIKGIIGVDSNSTEGVMMDSTATGAEIGGSIVPGWGHLIGAGAGFLTGAFQKGSVDPNTGEIQYGGIFGRSKRSLRNESNRIKTSLVDKIITQDLNEGYYSDPNNSINTNIYATAAEGGIMRQPVDALVSPGEIAINPYTLEYRQFGNDNEEPNSKDNIRTVLETGDNVKSHAKHMIMPNGKTPADNAKMVLDSNMPEEMKRKMIKKIDNWESAHRTKTQQYAKFDEGTGKSGVPDLSDMFLYRQKDGKFVMQDINGNRYDVPEMMLPYIQGDEHGYWFGPQTGIGPSAGKWNGSMNFAKQMLNSKNIAKLKNSTTKVFGKNVKPANVNGPIKHVTGTSPEVLGKPKTVQEAAQMARNERTANMWQQLTSKGSVPQKTLEGPQTWATARGSSNLWENPMTLQSGDDIASAINTAYYLNKGLPTAFGVSAMLGGAGTFLAYEATKDKRSTAANTATTIPINTDNSTVVMAQEKPVEPVVIPTEAVTENRKKKAVVPKKSSIDKPSSGKKTTTSQVTTQTVPSPEDTVVRRPIYEEPVKTVTVPTDDTKVYGRDGRVAYDYTAPETKVTPKDLGRTVDDNNNYTGSDWRDNLYRMAVLSQPLWGRAKAEPVNYESPVYKGVPTAVDVLPYFRDINQNYASSIYDIMNNYRNSGAGISATIQAANDRAKQLADIRQYQTNAQNELIGKNVGIYNNWANEHAKIMNDVYDKNAANRATARNINRQNIAAALSNYGQILRDDKLLATESQNNKLKTKILEPFVKAVYENSDELVPMITQYGTNKNIKKKQINR